MNDHSADIMKNNKCISSLADVIHINQQNTKLEK